MGKKPVSESIYKEVKTITQKIMEEEKLYNLEKEINIEENESREETQTKAARWKEHQTDDKESVRDMGSRKRKEEKKNQCDMQKKTIIAKRGKTIMENTKHTGDAFQNQQRPPNKAVWAQSYEADGKGSKNMKYTRKSTNIGIGMEKNLGKSSSNSHETSEESITEIITSIKEKLKMERAMARRECENNAGRSKKNTEAKETNKKSEFGAEAVSKTISKENNNEAVDKRKVINEEGEVNKMSGNTDSTKEDADEKEKESEKTEVAGADITEEKNKVENEKDKLANLSARKIKVTNGDVDENEVCRDTSKAKKEVKIKKNEDNKEAEDEMEVMNEEKMEENTNSSAGIKNKGKGKEETSKDHSNAKSERGHDKEKRSFAEVVKGKDSSSIIELEYYPPIVLPNGDKVVDLTEIMGEANVGDYSCYLYGHFVEDVPSRSYIIINLRRMWKQFGLIDIAWNQEGFFFFKFSTIKGLNYVQEKAPWVVNKYPLILQKWEPGMTLKRVEPQHIPIWACIYNIPQSLWDGKGISNLFSGIGKPLMMDKLTKERCTKQEGVEKYARVLVEVDAKEDLPEVIKVKFPDLIDSKGKFNPGRMVRFKASYPWKPHKCSLCCVFGHKFDLCNKRNMNEDINTGRDTKSPPSPIKQLEESKNSRSFNIKMDREGYTTINRKRKGAHESQKEKWKTANSQLNYHNRFGILNEEEEELNAENIKEKDAKDRGSYVKTRKKRNDQNGRYFHLEVDSKSDTEETQNKAVRGFIKDQKMDKISNQEERKKEDPSKTKEKVVSESVKVKQGNDENENGIEWDEDLQLWRDQQDEVMDYLLAKKYPTIKDETIWTKEQYQLFYRKSKEYGLDLEKEEEEVDSDVGDLASFMKEGSKYDGNKGKGINDD